jgi:threonine dehydrogenase-like Zn-dependent dehydrogenase
MEVIKESPVVEKLITHRFSFSSINDALAVSASHQCGKIIIDPWN